MGYWKFQYTFNSDSYTDYILMSAIMSTTYSDGNYYTAGTNSDGDLATGGIMTFLMQTPVFIAIILFLV